MIIDKTTIGISSLIALMIVTASSIVPNFFQEDKYFCEERPDVGIVECDSFSKYVDPNGKCIREDNTNLICRSGWKHVINDVELPEEEIGTLLENRIKYKCKENGCEEI